MTISADIISINQEIDLERGGLLNYVTLRLPSGVQFRAAIDDAGAGSIVEAFVTSGGSVAPTTRLPSPPPELVGGLPVTNFVHQELPVDPQTGAEIFGGGDVAVAQPPAPPPPPVEQQQRRAPHVAKDDYGYPIVPRTNVVMSENQDEDGVGQL